MLKIFCSGRFYFDYHDDNYLVAASKDYRAKLLGDVRKLLYPQNTYMIGNNVEYIGPYYFECEEMEADNIVATECEMLRRCTDAIFILDEANAPGSIAELIFAASLGKRIHIYFVQLTDDKETESQLHTANWYPILMSKLIAQEINVIPCRSREDAERQAIEKIIAL